MSNFDKMDSELKELWGDFASTSEGKKAAAVLNELSEVEAPRGLAAKLKNFGEAKFAIPVFMFKPAAAFVLIAVIFMTVFYRTPEPAEYANLDAETYVENSFLPVDAEEDIFDETLMDLEEILWSA